MSIDDGAGAVIGMSARKSTGGAPNVKAFVWIEYLRFACAISVVLWHYQHFFDSGEGTGSGAFNRGAQPFYSLLFPFYSQGSAGVSVFWGISGLIFFWKYAVKIHDKALPPRRFAVLRFSRLYPLHLLTLILVLVLQLSYFRVNHRYFVYANNSLASFFSNLFFVSGWPIVGLGGFNMPIWSVSIEILVYLTFFVLARNIRFDLLKSAAVSAVFWGLSTLTASSLPVCGAYFFMGGAVYYLTRRSTLSASAKVWTVVGIIFLMTAALFVRRVSHWFGVLTPCAIFSALTLAVLFNDKATPLLSRYSSALGNMTYSSYLIHFPLQCAFVLVSDAVVGTRSVYYGHIAFVAFWAALLPLSYFCYRFFERPTQDRIRSELL